MILCMVASEDNIGDNDGDVALLQKYLPRTTTTTTTSVPSPAPTTPPTPAPTKARPTDCSEDPVNGGRICQLFKRPDARESEFDSCSCGVVPFLFDNPKCKHKNS